MNHVEKSLVWHVISTKSALTAASHNGEKEEGKQKQKGPQDVIMYSSSELFLFGKRKGAAQTKNNPGYVFPNCNCYHHQAGRSLLSQIPRLPLLGPAPSSFLSFFFFFDFACTPERIWRFYSQTFFFKKYVYFIPRL